MLELDSPVKAIFFDSTADAITRHRIDTARRRTVHASQEDGQKGMLRPFQALEQISRLASVGDVFGMAEVLKHTAFSNPTGMYRALRYYGLPRE